MKKTFAVLPGILFFALTLTPAASASAADADPSGGDFCLKLMNADIKARRENERLACANCAETGKKAGQVCFFKNLFSR